MSRSESLKDSVKDLIRDARNGVDHVNELVRDASDGVESAFNSVRYHSYRKDLGHKIASGKIYSSMTARFTVQVEQEILRLTAAASATDAESISGDTAVSDSTVVATDDAPPSTVHYSLGGTGRLWLQLLGMYPADPSRNDNWKKWLLNFGLHMSQESCGALDGHSYKLDAEKLLRAYNLRNRGALITRSDWDDWEKAFDKVELSEADVSTFAAGVVAGDMEQLFARVHVQL